MKTIRRQEAVDALREKLISLTDDEHCMCDVAAHLKVFCGGWSQWTTAELKERYHWIAKRRPRIARAELEELANRWQLARQFVHDTELACDTQTKEHHHPICGGWTHFTDGELAEFYREILGEEVEIRDESDDGCGPEAGRVATAEELGA